MIAWFEINSEQILFGIGIIILAAMAWLVTGCGFIKGVRQFDNNPKDKPAIHLNE